MATGKKIFLDTNFWLRYVLVDNQEQYPYVLELVKLIENGRYSPYTSSIVFLEVYFMLSRYYQKSSIEVNKYLNYLLSIRNLVVIEKTNLRRALAWHQKIGLKLPDCLIASSLPKGCLLISWDKDFDKIKEIKSKTPEELIKSLKT